MSRNNRNQLRKASVGAAASSDEDEAAFAEDDSTDDDHDEASYVPLNGSWIVELEEAQKDLEQQGGGRDASPSSKKKPRKGNTLQAYRRMCRAYMKLRQWERVVDAAHQGLEVCTLYHSTIAKRSRIAEWEKCFRTYRNRAKSEWTDEQVLPTRLHHPKVQQILDAISTGQADPNKVVLRPHGVFLNSNFLQEAALVGDLLLLEEIVARGAAVDYPFMNEQPESATYRPLVVAPHDATALVIVCFNLVLAFSNHHPDLDVYRAYWGDRWCGSKLDLSVLCAMQLVRYGAEPRRTLNLSNSHGGPMYGVSRRTGLDGMSALELVRLLRRHLRVDKADLLCLDSLIELMEEHVRYSAIKRANVVECRCGSRLPWMSCHGGIGGETDATAAPAHFCVLPKRRNAVAYRLSPRARCPCHRTTTLSYYECCWKDTTKKPMYLIDRTAEIVAVVRRVAISPAGRIIRVPDPAAGRKNPNVDLSGSFVDAGAASLLWNPTRIRELFANEGPKSKWRTWDADVYAGCVQRLNCYLFQWKDLHSNLDESELLERVEMWNEALERYCDDKELAGQRRERVIATHRANPCGPCGRVGCDAFETEVREFPRCSRCKSIAYCGRRCQKLDWAAHKKNCVAA